MLETELPSVYACIVEEMVDDGALRYGESMRLKLR